MCHGVLVMAPCDTLAAQWLGGFKEGVGFAHRVCRTCDVDNNTRVTHFSYQSFRGRDHEEHIDRCAALDSLSKNARRYWSKQCGSNRKSVLLDIKGFDSAVCLVHDPMHVLLEGIVPYFLQLLLYEFIYATKYFTLAKLNSQIATYPNKPEKITEGDLSPPGRIKQTAVAMLVMCCNLPLMIASSIPEDHANGTHFCCCSRFSSSAQVHMLLNRLLWTWASCVSIFSENFA